MGKGGYPVIKRNLINCELLFQKFCLYLKEEKFICNFCSKLESFLKVGIANNSLQMFGKFPLEMESLIS